MILFVLSALASEPTLAPAPIPEVYRFVETQRRLDLDLRTGTLSVRTDANASGIEVRISAPTACTTTWDTGGIIEIRDCTADVQVVAPFGTSYALNVGTGDVHLDTTGKVRLSVTNGDVTGTARGPVRVNVRTGDVRLQGLTQEPVIAVASGQTELSYVEGVSGS